MKKEDKKSKNKKTGWLRLLAAVLVIVIVGGAVWFVSSPMPVVLAVRYMMNRPAALSYPEGQKERDKLVEVVEDLYYPSADGNNRYDLYLPKERTEKVPLIVWVHGGAFVAGAKSGVRNWGMTLASEGIAVAAVDYEWAPEIAYPGQLRQVQECIQELERQTQWNLDMDHIVLAGDSAGAHIAAQCALVSTAEGYAEEISLEPVLEKEQIAAILLFCGPYDAEEVLNVKGKVVRLFMRRIGWSMFGQKDFENSPLLPTANIIDNVTEDFPVCFLTDGNTGSFESHGKALAEALTGLGVETETLFFDKEVLETGHEYQYDLEGEAGAACYRTVLTFLEEIGWFQGKSHSSSR